MRSRVRLRLPDGEVVDLGHGDLVGRSWNAALILDDPRVSEAHALVSLRGHELKLLALRGRLAVDGKPLPEVVLRPGLVVALAGELAVEVVDVELPDVVLGLRAEGMGTRALPGTCALVARPTPTLAPPSHVDAVAHAWWVPEGWRLRPVGGAPRPLEAGDRFEVGGVAWEAVDVPLGGVAVTHAEAWLDAPLRVVARYDTVQLHREGRPAVTLHGLSARVVSELVAFGAPVPWSVLAGELWPGAGSRKQLDMALFRLRRRLRDERVRADLVRTSGDGLVELFLHPDDVVEDQT